MSGLVVCWLSVAVGCELLLVVCICCSLMFVVYCLLCVVCSLLLVVCCLWFVVGWWLFVACCVACVACVLLVV